MRLKRNVRWSARAALLQPARGSRVHEGVRHRRRGGRGSVGGSRERPSRQENEERLEELGALGLRQRSREDHPRGRRFQGIHTGAPTGDGLQRAVASASSAISARGPASFEVVHRDESCRRRRQRPDRDPRSMPGRRPACCMRRCTPRRHPRRRSPPPSHARPIRCCTGTSRSRAWFRGRATRGEPGFPPRPGVWIDRARRGPSCCTPIASGAGILRLRAAWRNGPGADREDHGVAADPESGDRQSNDDAPGEAPARPAASAIRSAIHHGRAAMPSVGPAAPPTDPRGSSP